MTELPFRRSARILLIDQRDRVLLARHLTGSGPVWVAPGGGIEPGETPLEAGVREFWEEVGCLLLPEDAAIEVWVQHQAFSDMVEFGYGGVEGHYFLVHAASLPDATTLPDPGSEQDWPEGIQEMRWWPIDELGSATDAGILFSPRDLSGLLRRAISAIESGALPEQAPLVGL